MTGHRVCAVFLLAALPALASIPPTLRGGETIGVGQSRSAAEIADAAEWRLTAVRVVYTNASYNAFPFVAAWSNVYWLSLREGDSHLSTNGIGRILSSPDGVTWSNRGTIKSPDSTRTDVRECHVFRGLDDRLYCRTRIYGAAATPTSSNLVYVTSDGDTWAAIRDTAIAWQTVRVGDTLYAANSANLRASTNGQDWTSVATMPAIVGRSSEIAAWADDSNVIWLAMRNSSNDTASTYTHWSHVLRSDPPYTQVVESATLPWGLAGGPWAIRRADGSVVIGTREVEAGDKIRTLLYEWTGVALTPRLALHEPGAIYNAGYVSALETNGTIVGAFYSDNAAGWPCVYWFEAED